MNYLTHKTLSSTAAVLNLFRLADHLTNFVLVRGPPKMSTFSRKISEFLTIFLKSFSLTFFLGSRTIKKNFANFPNFLAFFRVKDRKKHSNFHLQSSCDSIHEKVPSLSSQFRQKPV